MFDMTVFSPREFLPSFTALGKQKWFEASVVTEDGEPYIKHAPDYAVVRKHVSAACFDVIADTIRRSPASLSTIIAVSACLANGPKVLRLDPHVCDSLRDITANVSPRDYTQPYDAFIVELPRSLGDTVVPRPIHPYVLAYQDRSINLLSFVFVRQGPVAPGEYRSCVAFDVIPRGEETVEDFLARDYTHEVGPTYGTWSPEMANVIRVVVNACILATYAGVKGAGWLDPKAHAKHEKLARRDARGGALLAGDVSRIVFDQQVKCDMVVRVAERADRGDGTHRSPHPHNRKRHWCMQPYGPGSSLRKLILRKGSFVRLNAFVKAGHDQSELHTTYSVPATDGPNPGA